MFKISYSIHCSKLLLLHPFNGLFSRPTRVSRYQKGKTSLDLNEAREDEVLQWQWHQLDHIQTICTSLQTDNHNDSSFTQLLQAPCSSWCPTNSVKALLRRQTDFKRNLQNFIPHFSLQLWQQEPTKSAALHTNTATQTQHHQYSSGDAFSVVACRHNKQ